MSSTMAGGASDKHDHVQALASDARNSHAVVHAMQAVEGGEDDEEEESMPLDVLQGFADRVQRLPPGDGGGQSSRPKIVIPKRGEKDFEPLEEATNLQDMMLHRSREALFGALTGVRGGASKTTSHAVLLPDSPYPRLIVTRGHLLDTMGISVAERQDGVGEGKKRSRIALLPEESLYLLERGSLQIWILADEPDLIHRPVGFGEWSDNLQGVVGAVEMSVMQGFASFLQQDSLTLQRYQAYAYLKRLGFVVQRARAVLPTQMFFNGNTESVHSGARVIRALPPFRPWWFTVGTGLFKCLRSVWTGGVLVGLARMWLRWTRPRSFALLGGSLLSDCRTTTYAGLRQTLRITPAGHGSAKGGGDVHDETSLTSNPYTPFWMVWKPARPWSKAKWAKGSSEGLAVQPPDYAVAVVEGRGTPMPTSEQLADAFRNLPDTPLVTRRDPGVSQSTATHTSQTTGAHVPKAAQFDSQQSVRAIRNGDRALIVAVNDSGNTGWIRFGRTQFGPLT